MPVTIGGSGPITGVTSINTTVSDTELGYLDGVTSAIQTQIDSKVTTPGVWTTYTPTLTGLTIGNGSITAARYSQVGKTVNLRIYFTFGTTTAITGDVQFSLPVTAVTTWHSGSATYIDNSTGDFGPLIGFSSTANFYVRALLANGTYATGAVLSSSIPIVWAINDSICIAHTYEAA